MAKRSRFFWFLLVVEGMAAGALAFWACPYAVGDFNTEISISSLTIIAGALLGIGLAGLTDCRRVPDAIVQESSRDFKRNLRAYADGDMTIERFVALWSGNVPPKPKVCGPAPVRAVSDQADTLKKFFIRIGADAEFRPAQWVRLKATGELAQVLREAYWAGEAWFYELSGPRHAENRTIARATDIEPALPKAGEWWIKDQCVRDELHGGHWLYAPFEWKGNYPISRPDVMAINCGCLHPLEFGRGTLVSKDGPRFHINQWVRLKAGVIAALKLAQVSAVSRLKDYAYHLMTSEGIIAALEQDIEIAVPKKGEWWEKRECPVLRKHMSAGIDTYWSKVPVKWQVDADTDPAVAEAVSCGCLVPINFGKGYRNDPPGPRFNKGQWARVALVTGDGNLVWITDDPIIVDGRRHYRISAVDGSRCVLAESSLERAYPRRGEWWVKKPCPQCDPGVAWSHEPYEWPFDFPPSPLDSKGVECGCRVPWNWGKPPASSGGAGGSGGCAMMPCDNHKGSLRIE